MAPIPTETRYDVVIVGAGYSGAQAAVALRQRGYQRSILIIGEDPELPYERPALKEYLSGDKSFDRLPLRSAAFWDERDIALRLGLRPDAQQRKHPQRRHILGSATALRGLAGGGPPAVSDHLSRRT